MVLCPECCRALGGGRNDPVSAGPKALGYPVQINCGLTQYPALEEPMRDGATAEKDRRTRPVQNSPVFAVLHQRGRSRHPLRAGSSSACALRKVRRRSFVRPF